MSTEIIFLVEESLEGGYEAKALGHSIYTEADTMDALKEAIADSVLSFFWATNFAEPAVSAETIAFNLLFEIIFLH